MFWTDEKVQHTVTTSYIYSNLRPNEQEILKRPLYFGAGLTDDTYLDRILVKAKRFFIILVSAGVSEQIFGILDEGLDDDDLPIVEEAVPFLRLTSQPDQAVDKRFFKTQFRFLTRILEDGEHIRYAGEETVPIMPHGLKASLPIHKDGVDTVKLPSDPNKVFVRRRVNIDSKVTEEQVLAEIAEMKKFSHQHVISVYGSYLQNGVVGILSLPAAEYSLKSFLTDIPKAFETLSKSERRQTLINWPHCMANAVAWLHSHGGHHGAIRPSNVLIGHGFEISLGPLDGEGILCSSVKPDDIESYQYAAPERWKRAVTVQSTGSGKVGLPSGGRSKRSHPTFHDPADPSTRKRSASSLGSSQPDNTGSYAFMPASKSEFARYRISTSAEPQPVIAPVQKRFPVAGTTGSNGSNERGKTPIRNPPVRRTSLASTSSSEDRKRGLASLNQGVFAAAHESRAAVVQTWRSVQHDSFAADVFSIGAVILDILTILCKKSYSSFARHRSAKNRMAGRGGGLADASFHANLGQVISWAQLLAEEAEKKAKKDDSQVLRAVGPIIQLIVQCLDRNPEARLKSDYLERMLGEHTLRFAGLERLHCTAPLPEQVTQLVTRQRSDLSSQYLRQYDLEATRSQSNSRPTMIREESPPSPPSTLYRPSTSETTRRPVSPLTISLNSLSTMDFDVDGRSDTMVNMSTHSREVSLEDGPHKARMRPHVATLMNSTPRSGSGRHSHETSIGARSAVSTDDGAFTYWDEEEEPTTFHYPLPPGRAPSRELPPVPSLPSPLPSPRMRPRRQQIKPDLKDFSPEELAVLRKLSKAVNEARHPPRGDSLKRKGANGSSRREQSGSPPQDTTSDVSFRRPPERVYRTK